MEFQFYMITPFIVMLACSRDGKPRRFGYLTLSFIFLVFQAIRVWVYYANRTDTTGASAPQQMINLLWTRGHTYLCGIAACIAYSAKSLGEEPSKKWKVLDVLASLMLVAIICMGNGMDDKRWVAHAAPKLNEILILFSQGATAMATSWLALRCCSGHLPRLNSMLSLSAWVPIARLSYAAYLLQFFAIEPLHDRVTVFRDSDTEVIAFSRWVLYCAVVLVMVFLIAFSFFMFVEGPSLRLRNLFTPRCLKRG